MTVLHAWARRYASGMEPVTHFLTGACLARAGFNRKAAYATLAMTLAAEMPDIDVLWGKLGPITGFQHHRGITHTFVGIPFEAAIVVAVMWALDRWRRSRGKTTLAPARWGRLWVFCLIALLSHLLLDWTNNYGLRPFFPFNPRWYAGSFVFIFEPVMFALLLLGLVVPALFGLIDSEVGERRRPFRGRGWAVFALLGVAVMWGVRAFERGRAEQIAATEQMSVEGLGGDVLRVFASPYPVTPFTWHVIVETPQFYQLMKVDTLRGQAETTNVGDRFYKPAETADTLAAKRSLGGRVFLDWSMFPIVSSLGADPADPNLTIIRFRDLRFVYNVWFFHGREQTPLETQVYVDRAHQAVFAEMGGRRQGE